MAMTVTNNTTQDYWFGAVASAGWNHVHVGG